MDQSIRLDLFSHGMFDPICIFHYVSRRLFLGGYGVIHMCFHNFFQMFAVNRSICFSESSNQMLDCNIWLKTLSFLLRTDHLVIES